MLIVGCSSDGEDNLSDPVSNTFVGSWNTECYTIQDGGFTEYFTDETRIEANSTYTGLFREYPEAGCTGNSTRTEAYNGSYSLGSAVVTSDGVTATELDIDGVYDGEPQVYQTIIYRSGDLLYFGLGEGDTRPSRLDFDRPFILQ